VLKSEDPITVNTKSNSNPFFKILLLLLVAICAYAQSFNHDMIQKISLLDSNQSSFSFAVMGDNREGNKIFEKILLSINKDKDIVFAVNNGDLVDDGDKKEIKEYIKLIQSSKKPIISIIGNHEVPLFGTEKNYKDFFGKPYFSFRYANSYFIILDDSNKKKIPKKEYKWLKKELKKAQNFQHIFVFMHVPLYDPRRGKYTKGHSLKSLKNAKKLNKLFDKYGINMLFCSHIHSYFKGFWHKTPYIITGGAGAPLNENGFYHYIKVTVSGDKVEYKVVKLQN